MLALPARLPTAALMDSGFNDTKTAATNVAANEGLAAGAAVLIVDDEAGILESLGKVFEREAIPVLTAARGAEALELLRRHQIAVLLCDLMMPGMSGMDLLRSAKAVSPETEVVLMTAYGTIENAVTAMKEGAYDFVTKPLKRAHVVRIVRNALEKHSLLLENRILRAQLQEKRRRALIGSAPAWRRIMETIAQAAPSAATVLLLGESGTGKELLARRLHEGSPRASKPFVTVNCAAIPESLLEAELFGYERGAFTGATARRQGRFESANGGTLFLDEIGEIPLQIQVKLLRVLQEGEVERLGAGGKPTPIDIRLVAATNQDLARRVREGAFRDDLYYRLKVISIAVPPLRERREDVPLLVEHFTQVYRGKNVKQILGCSRRALDCLCRYSFPGNVRELENLIERAVVLARTNILSEEDFPDEIRNDDKEGAATAANRARALTFAIGTPLHDVERQMIQETLRHTRGDKRVAAQLLGIATRTIYRKLDEEASPSASPTSSPGSPGSPGSTDSATGAETTSEGTLDSEDLDQHPEERVGWSST
ncbi:MAG: sigma-54 dependent transcriptional regulator [Pseudomonadota bacterium]